MWSHVCVRVFVFEVIPWNHSRSTSPLTPWSLDQLPLKQRAEWPHPRSGPKRTTILSFFQLDDTHFSQSFLFLFLLELSNFSIYGHFSSILPSFDPFSWLFPLLSFFLSLSFSLQLFLYFYLALLFFLLVVIDSGSWRNKYRERSPLVVVSAFSFLHFSTLGKWKKKKNTCQNNFASRENLLALKLSSEQKKREYGCNKKKVPQCSVYCCNFVERNKTAKYILNFVFICHFFYSLELHGLSCSQNILTRTHDEHSAKSWNMLNFFLFFFF